MKKHQKIWSDTFGPIIKGNHIHHIIPRSEGGKDVLGNLISLHPDDHLLIHRRMGVRKISDEHRANLSKSHMGNNKETCPGVRRMAEFNTGKTGMDAYKTDKRIHTFSHPKFGEVQSTRLGLKAKYDGTRHIETLFKAKAPKTTGGWSLVEMGEKS